ncbi:MAG: hypothetical protein IPQ11_08405 [Bacteroidetes bacterium]|nr:hypothetical protein [Bacteroidota bacterium]
MIGIRESAATLKIANKHTDFVCKEIFNRIDFYIEIFTILNWLKRKKCSRSEVNEMVIKSASFHKVHSQYKFLINGLFIDNKLINSRKNIYRIQSFHKLKNPLSNYTTVITELQILRRNIKKLLLLEFKGDYKQQIRFYYSIKKKTHSIYDLIPYIIDYKYWFISLKPGGIWGPYELIQDLNLNVCPYCNRLYTITVIGGVKNVRPELDHFLPFHEHKLLALSFYNLVPSCDVCNRTLKSSKSIFYKEYLNPFEENLGHKLMTFSYIPKTYEASIGNSNDMEIQIKYTGPVTDLLLKRKVENNIELFKLKEVYQQHVELVGEILKKRHISGDKYIDILKSTFKGCVFTDEELFLLAYGNFYKEIDFCKRPMSKLTKDIAFSVGSIKSGIKS